MQKWFSKVVFVVSISALSIVSCTKKENATSGSPGAQSGGAQPSTEVVKLGHFASLTGGVAAFGTSTRKGVDLALEEFNKAGGWNGKPVELVTYDTQSKAEEAAAAVTKMITQDMVHGLIGEVASSLSIVAADKAMQFKTPMLSPSSTNPSVTKKGEYIFRICFIDPFQGEVMAKFAKEQLKGKTAAVIRDVAQDYSIGLADAFVKSFTGLGGKIVLDTSYQSKDTDFRAQLTDIKGKKPDVIFLPGYYNEVALIVRQARQMGVKQPILGGDGWESEDLVKVAGKEPLENTYFSNHYAPDTKEGAAVGFIERYKARYNGELPSAMAALGFDAFNVMMDAIKRAGKLDREAIKIALASTKDFQGVTGKITINEERNAVKSAVVLKFKDGKPSYHATVNP
jgi:branched-chain amino acid transport system substrate-binding protein